MKNITKSYIAILMGIIIAIADVVWLLDSYFVLHWLVLGIIIFIANAIWLYIDYSFMAMAKKGK